MDEKFYSEMTFEEAVIASWFLGNRLAEFEAERTPILRQTLRVRDSVKAVWAGGFVNAVILKIHSDLNQVLLSIQGIDDALYWVPMYHVEFICHDED